MNIDLMRKIDYYIGVPICFVIDIALQIYTFIAKFLNKKQNNVQAEESTSKNILFIELSEMGSAVIVDPVLYRAKHDGYNVFFVIFKKNVASLQILNTIPASNIFTIDPTNFLTLTTTTLKFLLWTRQNKIDTVIDLELFSRFTALLSIFAGAKTRIGFHKFSNEGLYRGNFLTHNVAYNPFMHISQNFFALYYALKEKPNNECNQKHKEKEPLIKYQIPLSSVHLRKIDTTTAEFVEKADKVAKKISELLPNYNTTGYKESHKLVLVNPNAGDILPLRKWGTDNFIKLITQILNEYKDVYILVTGAPAEVELCNQIVNAVNSKVSSIAGVLRCNSIAGQIGFLELTTLYSQSTLMITNDSGPAHFASVTQMPTVVLFGPETPSLYHSLGTTYPIWLEYSCSPCVSAWNHRKTTCTNNLCLQNITTDMVLDKIKSNNLL